MRKAPLLSPAHLIVYIQNMHESTDIQIQDTTLDLCFGPLHYRFSPEDSWGVETVKKLAGHMASTFVVNPPDRIVSVGMPTDHSPVDNQGYMINSLGVFRYSPTVVAARWCYGADARLPEFRYQLPWPLILADITHHGGAVAHAGLAIHNERGVLFLAPPGGGKSTTLATAPTEWEVLSDDAALVWPEGDRWLASPLPSWTEMTATGSPPTTDKLFDPARQCQVHAMVVLVKGPNVRMEPLESTVAATHTYRALSEYPSTAIAGLPLAEKWFRTAAAMARTLPCKRLQLPLGGDIWTLLAKFSEGLP